MNCSRCHKQITQEDAFAYEGKMLCEDCLMEIGLHPKGCEPWATYIATHTPGGAGPKGKQGLTDLQKKVHDYIKNKNRVSRDSVMQEFKLNESEMDAQMTALFHSEMVKEVREGNKVLLFNLAWWLHGVLYCQLKNRLAGGTWIKEMDYSHYSVQSLNQLVGVSVC